MIHKTTERASAALKLLDENPQGLIRHEIAERMKIPLSSACSLVHSLLSAGQAVESGDTRRSPYGQPARIVRMAKAETVMP